MGSIVVVIMIVRREPDRLGGKVKNLRVDPLR
jgi:hypothetical protein